MKSRFKARMEQSKGGAEPTRSAAVQNILRVALQHHQVGRLNEAEQLYRKVLAIAPQQPDSLHLLGVLEYQAGRYDGAVRLIRGAIAIHEREAAYHCNLGTVLHAQGKLDEAAACYERALVLSPGRARTHYNLGNVFHAQEKFHEAAACFKQALALEPDLAEAHYNLGNTFQAQESFEEAIACYRHALAIEPTKFEALHNLGNTLQAQDKLEDAMQCYGTALSLRPADAKAHFSLGTVLHSLGDPHRALASYQRALNVKPDFSEAIFSSSLSQLLQGNFAEGWRNYEARWQTKEHTPPMRSYAQPLWRGEQLGPGRLLIWGEQGIGDEIMFSGLIPDLARTANGCVLDCDARLNPLFARSFPGVEVISTRISGNDAARQSDTDIAAHIPIGSLPRVFRPHATSFSLTTSPYLIADRRERQQFRDRYSDGRRLVGLAWYTNNRRTGRKRSIDLSLLAPLFARSDIRWVSLQYGDPADLESQSTAAHAPLLIDRTVDQLLNIDRFAAQVAAMDLIITIDNSTAHLAGALGIPTWVLLPFVPDWRWLQSRDDSPWYPTLRLFRQRRPGDWQTVIAIVGKLV